MLNEAALVITLLLPFLAGVTTFLAAERYLKMIVAGLLPFLVAAPLQVAARTYDLHAWRYEISGWKAPLGINLHMDGLAAVMLLLTAAVCTAVACYALGYFGEKQAEAVRKVRGFWSVFFFLWGALNAIFLVADLFSLYVCLELITLAAVAAIALEPGAGALKAANRYLMTALVGSLAYLLGVTLVYGQCGTLDWLLIRSQPTDSLVLWVALSLMTAGLMIKSALVPLHFWLPGAHSIAPAPVSALLSALVIKASFYVLLRFWVQVFPETSGPWTVHFIGALGAGAILWGSFQAIIQTRLKLMVAYSTVAQIGYLFLAFPLLKSAMDSENTAAQLDAWNGTIFFVLSHALAKSALFLVAGIFLKVGENDLIHEMKGTAARAPVATLTWGIAGMSLIGLPPSTGFLAKWLLLTSSIRFGYWTYGAVILVGGLLASIYVFRVLWFAFLDQPDEEIQPAAPAVMPMAALFLALLIVLLGVRPTELFSLMQLGSPFSGGDQP
ncbi:complex I subunit 5 family protein [Oligoflexus tunisiensis]|uniref:complex I subunit 5 family protein n=1 Tax=Oligoflexus tunisiensis TaxID=708132 RepID=UPI000AEF4F8E|nr:proton-conducting transporter membrane subunit [Oligoflexus tunisiensis]